MRGALKDALLQLDIKQSVWVLTLVVNFTKNFDVGTLEYRIEHQFGCYLNNR